MAEMFKNSSVEMFAANASPTIANVTFSSFTIHLDNGSKADYKVVTSFLQNSTTVSTITKARNSIQVRLHKCTAKSKFMVNLKWNDI